MFFAAAQFCWRPSPRWYPRVKFKRGQASMLALLLAGLVPCLSYAQVDTTSAPLKTSKLQLAHGLTFTYGIGAPYGWGVDYGRVTAKNLELTAGLGYDWSGFKAGFGTRYYLWREHRVATFLGGNLTYAQGRPDFTVSATQGPPESTRLRISPCVVARLRAGARWQLSRRLGLLSALGPGLVVGRDPVHFLDSTRLSPHLRQLICSRRPDSFELSVALSVRL